MNAEISKEEVKRECGGDSGKRAVYASIANA